jgi:hypothetical protein
MRSSMEYESASTVAARLAPALGCNGRPNVWAWSSRFAAPAARETNPVISDVPFFVPQDSQLR